MTATALLELKQSLSRLSESERRQVSAFLIRRGQATPAWKKDMARRLDEMASGKKFSVTKLRRQLGHA